MKRDLSFNIGLKRTNQVSFNIGSDKKLSLCCTMVNIPEEEKLKIQNDSIFVSKKYKEVSFSDALINFRENGKPLYIYDELFVKKYSKDIFNSNPLINMSLPSYKKELKIYEQEKMLFNPYKYDATMKKQITANVSNRRNLNLYKEEFVFKKLIETNDLSRDQQIVSRGKIIFQTINTIERLKKSIRYHSLDIQTLLGMSVNSKSMNDRFSNYFLDIKNRYIFYLNNCFLNIDNREMYYLDNEFVSINNRDLYYLKEQYTIEKHGVKAQEYLKNSLISKDIKPLELQHKAYYIFKSGSFLKRQYEDYSVSKAGSYLKRQYEDYFVNKNIIDAFREYKYFYINKGDKFTNREYRDISLYKENESINIDDNILNAALDGSAIQINEINYFAANEDKKMYIDDKNYFVATDLDSIRMYDTFGIGTYDRNISYIGDLLNSHLENKKLYMLEHEFMGKDNEGINLENHEFVHKDNESINLKDNVSMVELNSKGIFKDDDILGLKVEKHSRVIEDELTLNKKYNEMKHVSEEYFIYKKELKSETSKNLEQPKIDYIVKEVHVNKFKDKKSFRDNYEFVSVINSYEDWNEEVNNGLIDELLLPHKDYNYTSFLRELIDSDGKIKPEYITDYDASSMRYTVKLPIENPIEVYNYIGRDYIDLDVGFLKYFITLLESRWKASIYKYAAMYAVDVLSDMMEFLYDFFEKKYPHDEAKMKMAERCIQLFRWYSEMAILNNCKYEVEFATKKISVDYAHKSLNDFNNMTVLNNMTITDNYILEPIDKTLPCNITFVNTHKQQIPKLDLHFKLYNCNSQSSILITDNDNNVTETIYEPGIYDLNLELENKITIQYEPTDINQSIVISSASIANYPTRNFTVRYKGKLGDVNPILKDLFNKLLLVTDGEKAKVTNVAPATIAIYKMIEYFDLHHTDKLKGKRLTIKK